MSRNLLNFCAVVFLFLFLYPSRAYSQQPSNPTPTPCPEKTFLGQVTDFISNLGGLLQEKEIDKELQKVNDAGLPFTQTTQSENPCEENESAIASASHGYTIETNKVQATEDLSAARSKDTWWSSLAFNLDAIFNKGQIESNNYVSKDLPYQTAQNTVFYKKSEQKHLAQTNQQFDVLGDQATGITMDTALGMVQCADLPACVGKCCEGGGPFDSAEVPVSSEPVSPSDPSVPSDSSSWDGVSLGSCTPLEDGGPCDWRELAEIYFAGNGIRAKNASMICNVESGGDYSRLNDQCLRDTDPEKQERTRGLPPTRDFSGGLFQINMLAHCKDALRDDWEMNKSCTIIDGPKLQACKSRLLSPAGNIAEMMRISNGGENWNAWAAATNCNLRKPAGTPSIPTSPGYYLTYYSQRQDPYASEPFDSCDIKTGGCGPTTVAMILSSFGNKEYNPKKVVEEFYQKQPTCISTMTQAMDILMKFGFGKDGDGKYTRMKQLFYSANPQPLSPFIKNQIKQFIDGGSVVLATATINNIGHFFWIVDVDPIMVMDPWYQYNVNTGKPVAVPMDQRQIPYQVLYQSIRTIGKPLNIQFAT